MKVLKAHNTSALRSRTGPQAHLGKTTVNFPGKSKS